jgi:glycosyltransferase involved in cell wall biosynthesis
MARHATAPIAAGAAGAVAARLVAVHVGLNLVFLVPGEMGGLETYARELIRALAAERPDVRLTAFVSREARAAGGEWDELAEVVEVPVYSRNRAQWVRGEQQLLPGLARRAGIDVLHSLASTAPGRGRFRRVVTIHDLHYRVVPGAHFGVKGLGMRLLVPLAARTSDRVIAISRSTAADVRRYLHVADERVDVIPSGVGVTALSPPEPAALLRERHRLGDRRVALSVSAKRPHKNLARLLVALAAIPAERRPVLVVPGYPTPYERELRERAQQLGVVGDVRFLDWVSGAELEGLYALADVFVFPSLYEGFGLPVLEAMRRGVPVACSNRSSLPEVAGDAALLFDPEDPRAITTAIERVLGDPTEAQRLRTAGHAQAGRFSWAATARATAGSYERAMGRRGSA